MGTCYSKKASGGKRSYTTSDMASTRLEEASRLAIARPTPYMRSPNTNVEYTVKLTPPSTVKHGTLNNTDPSDIKNLKNVPQKTSIPRFSSSLPASTLLPTERKNVVNDNEIIHVVNNNQVMSSRSTSNISTLPSPVSKSIPKTESNMKPKSIGSKSCPDKIVGIDIGEKPSRNPRGLGYLRQSVGKSSPGLLHGGQESRNTSKVLQTTPISRNSNGRCPLSKSPSRKGFESHDSLSDFDSGIGNSLTDKSKPEDSDTVKDLEHLEFNEEFSPNLHVDACPSRAHSSTPKSPHNLKAPLYRREPNGKWSFDEKHFGSEPTRLSEPKSITENSLKERHSYKMNASENIFSTYASYKGLLSYQKKSFKPIDASKFNSREKPNTADKLVQSPVSNSSSIPKIRKQSGLPCGNSVFYIQSDCSTSGKTARNVEGMSKTPMQPSPDSDEKSDSTENGVISPPSDREFLIDDEISDQPGLTFFNDPPSEESDVQSLKQAVTELHALQQANNSKKRTDSVGSYSSRKSRHGDQRDSLILNSELGSSCSSIASDDLMMDYEKSFDNFPEGTINEGPASPMRKVTDIDSDKITPLKTEKKFDFEDKNRKWLHRRSSGPLSTSAERQQEWRQRTVGLPLRPPRQMTVSEEDDGCVRLDSSSYRLLCQDLNSVKTLLFRLKSVVQEAETINPFDQSNTSNIFYQSLVHNDFPSSMGSSYSSTAESSASTVQNSFQENADLRRQVVLLQQQLEEKDHTIHLLQQQMTKYLNIQGSCTHNPSSINAATQTERSHSVASSLSSSSADDSIETLVSFRITKRLGRF